MQQKPVRFGLPAVPEPTTGVTGEIIAWRQDRYYRITGYDVMAPFLVSVMSDSDLWMYVSSKGGLTAGRRSAEHSLFPYETVDKLHVSHTHTGPRTIIRCLEEGETLIWEPFADNGRFRYELRRSILKHVLGCEIWFEESNLSLGLTFRYGWQPSDRFGWVRTAEIVNEGDQDRHFEILDGVQNLLPAGVGTGLQSSLSSLVDAYKYVECDPKAKLTVFGLAANIVDRPEASEALRATVAWQAGMDDAAVILDGTSWDRFMLGYEVASQSHLEGRRGSYLLKSEIRLAPGETRSWHMALDTPVDQVQVVELKKDLESDITQDIHADIRRVRDHLSHLLACADAFQMTGDELATAHHTANVLFNIARGGVLPNQYLVDREDLEDFVKTRNRPAAERHSAWLSGLPETLSLTELRSRAAKTQDPDLIRLCDEYLPIVFSRRHGDPSRPWNRFSIIMKNPDGSARYAYEGNWRDIFQNWEALCRSFPECLEPMIAKFLNASTVDGFNPYRITREGIDWEVCDPDDPWSSIGYWGDHQIVYLLRLLEALEAHRPGRLCELLDEARFSYADVPYDIRPYAEIVDDPHDTITFDRERQRASDLRVRGTGSDGKLVHQDGKVLHVTLAEKLLVPILAKLSNLVPEGGIWMNTMRPEWNDANNALVGDGLSVVTACYLYRYLGFCGDVFDKASASSLRLSSRVAGWLSSIAEVLNEHCSAGMDDRRRRRYMDAVGQAYSAYRLDAYASGPGGPVSVQTSSIRKMLSKARKLVEAAIRANRREDGLYRAYDLLHLGDDSAAIMYLPLMLEGQVAVLSSGLLEPDEALALLKTLRAGPLYREDQNSYLLYPVRDLPAFLEKNVVPDSMLDRCPTLAATVELGERSVLVRDADGRFRFHPDFHNIKVLRDRIENVFPKEEVRTILNTYEEIFDHKAFTGRSGTMYGYEGIGCIYWHMIAKLLLAAQEACERAIAGGASHAVVDALKECYYDIRSGLGFTQKPDEFGAFPLDPYSHTPPFGGAKQPGMTGQVKEEILTRWGELGIKIAGGKITLRPWLLQDSEWLTENSEFRYIETDGVRQSLNLKAGSLALTFCQVPIVYVRGDSSRIIIDLRDGSKIKGNGDTLDEAVSTDVFRRTGKVRLVTVHITAT
jgi:hypothetical protein